MKKQNYNFQEDIVSEVLLKLKKSKKVLVAANCGLGKTFIGSSIIRDFVKRGKRVVVSAYSLNEIKISWLEKIIAHNLIQPKDLQVVSNDTSLNKKYPKIRFVKRSEIDKSIPVTVIIPQSVRKTDLENVDLFVIDEAHEYLEVEDGKLVGIIKEASHKETRIVGLTGTAHDLLDKEIFNREDPDVDFVIRDIFFALKTKTILPTEVHLEYFEFPIKKEFYKKDGTLNNRGTKLLSSKLFKQLQLKEVLKKCSNSKKTLVIVPRGDKINEALKYFIDSEIDKSCTVMKSSKQEDSLNRDAEIQFRKNPNIKFMVVVDMCGTGWDFNELDNVIDLTFTKNRKLIIQRMNRPCRYFEGKKPRYFYCTDQSKHSYEAPLTIMECFNLMTYEGITNPLKASREIMVDEKMLEAISETICLGKRRGSFCFGDIQKYFRNGKPRVSQHKTLVFNQFKNSEGLYPWQVWSLSLVGKNKKDYPKERLNRVREYLSNLKNTIPENSDLFLDKAKEALS